MKHDPYSLTELIRNNEFIAWVLHPSATSDGRWKQFLEERPDKIRTLESAREYVLLLAKDTGRHMPTSKQSDKMWRAVESHIHKKEE
jgi:transmembrane sensor